MKRSIAIVLIAGSCALLTFDRVPTPMPGSTLSIALRFANPASHNRNHCILNIRIGTDEDRTPARRQPRSECLAPFLESLLETARDALFKQLRIA